MTPRVPHSLLFQVFCPELWISAMGLALTFQFSCPLLRPINYTALVAVADPQPPSTMPDTQELIYRCFLQIEREKLETELAKESENYLSAPIWKVQLYEQTSLKIFLYFGVF